jgi:hypothetical protein
MELSLSWEAAKCAATQELPRILWNPKDHYRVHKSPTLVSILSQINPMHTIPSYLRCILILSIHLCLGLPTVLFPSGFPHQYPICIHLLPHSCYMPCPFHLLDSNDLSFAIHMYNKDIETYIVRCWLLAESWFLFRTVFIVDVSCILRQKHFNGIDIPGSIWIVDWHPACYDFCGHRYDVPSDMFQTNEWVTLREERKV